MVRKMYTQSLNCKFETLLQRTLDSFLSNTSLFLLLPLHVLFSALILYGVEWSQTCIIEKSD
jgi:hypothetical protein